HTFASWKQDCFRDEPRKIKTIPLSVTEVRIQIESETESFARRPVLLSHEIIWDDGLYMIRGSDVILVLEGQKIPVNKQVLASKSSFFMALFYGDFKESKKEEIEMKGINPEDFQELLLMVYGVSAEPKTVENAIRYLMLADKFDLQIVKDRMENFLLSTDLISIHRKILIAEDHRLEILKV
ncbi:hypothetical protein PENTCL1PPCAC_13139, partial [Pristionchus entomophagus]